MAGRAAGAIHGAAGVRHDDVLHLRHLADHAGQHDRDHELNFIRTARAKGLPLRHIILKHALRPAMLPVVSYLGPAFVGIITGSVVIETIFGLPGLVSCSSTVPSTVITPWCSV